MKKIIIFLMLMGACGGCLFAQTSTNNTVSVSSDGVAIKAKSLTLKLSNGALNIVNGTEQVTPSGTSTPVTLHYGYILPSLSSAMDIGSSSKFFRKIYSQYLYSRSSLQQFSDVRCKENIRSLEEATPIIRQLRPVTFDFKPVDSIFDTSDLKNKVGFIAQEVQAVLPHLVGYMPDIDIYTLDYTSILPYLVKAFQESQSEKDELASHVTNLENQLDELNGVVSGLRQQVQELVQRLLAQNGATPPASDKAPKHSPQNTVKAARLFQNLPNPFSESTIIRYELPKAAGNAYIQVFDMGGRMVENIQLSRTQEVGQVELSAGELLPGTYTYSLIVSGKVIDSKRMVVTE